MDNLMLEKIKELLATNENIGIGVGKNPGIDEMGGALSLYLALTETGKKVTVVCPTDALVEISSLVGIDKVKKSFDGTGDGDLIVSFPYKEGEIEKISYTLENGKLNILVKAGENGLNFNEKDVEYRRGGKAPGLVFVVGTPRLSDLGTAYDMEALKDSKVINIDYKPENQGFGDIPLLGRNASSVSELVASLLVSLGLNIDVDVASNLLSGIISATENFQNPQTSSLSFEMAGILMKKGGVRQINKRKESFIEDSFFTPKSQSNVAEANAAYVKPQPQTSSFPKTAFGTPARNASQSDAGGEEKKAAFAASNAASSEPTEDNPPDDWLAPKIYKGSTSI